jgi:hypothetical protein
MKFYLNQLLERTSQGGALKRKVTPGRPSGRPTPLPPVPGACSNAAREHQSLLFKIVMETARTPRWSTEPLDFAVIETAPAQRAVPGEGRMPPTNIDPIEALFSIRHWR